MSGLLVESINDSALRQAGFSVRKIYVNLPDIGYRMEDIFHYNTFYSVI